MTEREREEELERLRAENEHLHRVNLELLLRQSDLDYENHRVWEFVMAAKRFVDHLIGQGYQGGGKEWVGFFMGMDRLRQWMRQREEELGSVDQSGDVTEAGRPAV